MAQKRLTELSHGPHWFQNQEDDKKILVRYYTIPAHNEKVVSPVKLEEDIDFNGTPFRIMICNIADQKFKTRFMTLVKLTEHAEFSFEEVTRTLPTADYVIVTCPIYLTSEHAYDETVKKMDQFIGAIRPVVGNGFFLSLIREAIVSVATGNMIEMQGTNRIGGPVEGPFATRLNWDEVVEIRTKIESFGDKERVLLAVELFEVAARTTGPTNFFLYWVAIEVLTRKDKAQALKHLMATAYQSDTSYIQNTLGFEKLVNMRTNLFHHGVSHDISPEVERYMQVCFLDFLRQRIGLNCKFHLRNFVENGFDVSKLNSPLANGNTARVNIDFIRSD